MDRYVNTGARPSRRFPIEVRYSNAEHTMWTCYSIHRSRDAADRAYAEVRRDLPDLWVQMRDDINGIGIIRSHFERPRQEDPHAR
jgi:hypothetical protein